ncbi:MAG TPA: DUF6265 family protein [Thermoanaerobaculia bacterium]|nr:DUF6265 family protein [Thermoanaerobaculia bacterium]
MSARVESLGWMAGHWRRDTAGSVQEEVWLEPRGGCMLGMDRNVHTDGKVTWEHMRIQDEDGTLVFHTSQEGRPAIAFALTIQGESEAVFERSSESFPARIRYWREGRTLHCRIDGGGREMGWSWELGGARRPTIARPPGPRRRPARRRSN